MVPSVSLEHHEPFESCVTTRERRKETNYLRDFVALYVQGKRKNPGTSTLPVNTGIKAGLKGFEPLTYGLRVRRSAELSYKPLI
jgi:hypothetical protein